MSIFTRALLLSTLLMPVPAIAQVNIALRPYTVCKFDDGLAVIEKSPLPPGVLGRTVDTIAGPRKVAILRGEQLTLGYPAKDPFAKIKVEQLPPDSFDHGKQDLIANFDHILAGGDDSGRNMTFAVHPMLNGFEVHGLDRKKIEGSTMGIYLLIDDHTHIVTTAYFENQGPVMRNFSTLDEYAALRDHFLNAYTSCVHAPHVAAPAAKPRPKAKPKKRRSS
jgi:hypothetical protein